MFTKVYPVLSRLLNHLISGLGFPSEEHWKFGKKPLLPGMYFRCGFDGRPEGNQWENELQLAISMLFRIMMMVLTLYDFNVVQIRI